MIETGIKLSKLIVLGDVATGKTCLVNRSNLKNLTYYIFEIQDSIFSELLLLLYFDHFN